MVPNSRSPLFIVTFAAACSVLLAGCGGEPSKAEVKAEQSVYTSTADCAEAAKIDAEQCIALIEKAIEQHVSQAATYKTLKICEKNEGVERCERNAEDAYRPRLRAFLITFSNPPTALPLYSTKDGRTGFRKLDNSGVSGDDTSIEFSDQAVVAYEEFVGKT